MGVRHFTPNVLEHQARLILALADRKGWNDVQRLFVALVLVTGAFKNLIFSRKRGFYYAEERQEFQSQVERYRLANRWR